MSDTETTSDAIESLISACQEIVRESDVPDTAITFNVAKLMRTLGQIEYLLEHDGPLMDDVKRDWIIRLTNPFKDNEKEFFAFLRNAIIIALKVRQHPEIGISLTNLGSQ